MARPITQARSSSSLPILLLTTPGRAAFQSMLACVSTTPGAAALVLLACLSTPHGTVAQTPSVLSLLPVQDDALAIGDERTGTLSAADYLSTSDSYLDAWQLTGPVGTSAAIDLRSPDFDAFLYVVGPGLAETLSDDDSAGGCDARLTFTFLEEGPYRVVASSLSAGATGTYSIGVFETPPPALDYECGQPDPQALSAVPTDGRELRFGSTVDGSLDFVSETVEGRPVEAWTLQAVAGEPLSIVQESSAFDSYLYLLGPDIHGTLSDDDGGGDLNSRIDFTPGTEGPYTVVASALGEGAQGTYTLRVEAPLDFATLSPSGELEIGQEVTGLLGTDGPVIADGRRGQVWALEGSAGERVTIELLSEAFDAFLYVAGPGLAEPLTDDDGAGDLNSSLTLTFPESGSFRVIATALSTGSTGPYTLRVMAR